MLSHHDIRATQYDNTSYVPPTLNHEFIAIEKWVLEYLHYSKTTHRVKTYRFKKRVFERFLSYLALPRNFSVQNLTRAMVKDYLAAQIEDGRSGNAVNKDKTELSAAYEWAAFEYDNWPEHVSPFKRIKNFPEKRSPRYVPPLEDFWKVYDMQTGQDRVLLLAYLHLAARKRELFRLRYDDIDFDRGMIRLGTRKRASKQLEYDWLPMTDELSAALVGWIAERKMQPHTDPDHVFVCLDRRPANVGDYGKPFRLRQHFMRAVCRRAKVQPFGFHGIRHLTASVLFDRKCSLSHIQHTLRHKSPVMTSNYLHSLGFESVRPALNDCLAPPEGIETFNK